MRGVPGSAQAKPIIPRAVPPPPVVPAQRRPVDAQTKATPGRGVLPPPVAPMGGKPLVQTKPAFRGVAPPPVRFGSPPQTPAKPATGQRRRLAPPAVSGNGALPQHPRTASAQMKPAGVAPPPVRFGAPPLAGGQRGSGSGRMAQMRPGSAGVIQPMKAAKKKEATPKDQRAAWFEDTKARAANCQGEIIAEGLQGTLAYELYENMLNQIRVIGTAKDENHGKAAAAFEEFGGLEQKILEFLKLHRASTSFKFLNPIKSGSHYSVTGAWDDTNSLDNLFDVYRQGKSRNKGEDLLTFQSGRVTESIRKIPFDHFKAHAPEALVSFVQHLYATYHLEEAKNRIIDNRPVDDRNSKSLNSSQPGSMRSQHMNESGALPDISDKEIPKQMQKLQDYVSIYSGVPNNVADKAQSIGYVEYTAPGMSRDDGRVLFDYKTGQVYITASHYGYFRRLKGPHQTRRFEVLGQSRTGMERTNNAGPEKNPFFLVLPPPNMLKAT